MPHVLNLIFYLWITEKMRVTFSREILAFNDALPQFKEIDTTVLGELPYLVSWIRS